MKVLYLDCFSGISGDMFAGAMLDLCGGSNELVKALGSLSLKGLETGISKTLKGGISATDFSVADNEGHSGHHHRDFGDIRNIITKSALSENVKLLSLKIFNTLAEAEGKIHGVEPANVVFHEVGAVDSIADIVSAAFLIDRINPQKTVCSALNVGSGTVNTRHGLLPVPAPATAEIMLAAGIPFEGGSENTELVTPTGAAIAASLAQGFGPMPSGKIEAIGYGCGKKNLKSPNVLRAVLLETGEEPETDSVCVLETCVDDSTGEELGNCIDELFASGALDAYFTPVFMKKNRPAFQLTVMCAAEAAGSFAEIIFMHTGAIGIRRRISKRFIMRRKPLDIQTKFGKIRCKQCEYQGIKKCKPEYESLKTAAKANGVSLRQVYNEAMGVLSQAGYE